MAYDSKKDTEEHIRNVQWAIHIFVQSLMQAGRMHDKSKMFSPEKEILDEWTPKLRNVTYGSDEYREMLAQMKPFVEHHHKKNRHHPEYYDDGISGMTLMDVVEMFCDWKAATLRHDDGDIRASIRINKTRHGLEPQLEAIFMNTVNQLRW